MEIRFVPSVIILQNNRVRGGKKTRASKPKVRSGCLTCKQRHVKCDERKPNCLRCESGLYRCDGYMVRPVPEERGTNTTGSFVYETSKRLPLILPKPIDRKKREASGSCRTQQDIPRFPSSFLFDERDATYFDLFRTHIVKDLSGYVYSEFWSRTILRESIEDECVRHCVLGVGALSRSLQYQMHPANQHVAPRMEDYELSQHRRAALKHYGKALGLYRQQMEFLGDRLSTRRILAVTLLLIVFEFLQGHIATVDNLITCSVKLLRKELRTLQSPSLPGSDTDEAEDLLARLSALSAISPSFPSSQRNCDILNATPPDMVPDHRSDINTITIMWKSSHTRVCIFGSRSQIASFNDPQFQPKELEEEREAYLRNLREWKVFFVSRMKIETDTEHLRSLLLMTIQCHIGSLYVRGCTDSQGGITYDHLTDEYRQIISLFRLFLEDPGEKPRMSFTFEVAILPSICMIIHTCRHQDIRDDAASILSSLIEKWGDFREGPWDSRMLAKGFRALMSLEKAGMDETGFIPPSARYRWTGIIHDKDNSQTIAVFTGLLLRGNVRETKHVALCL